MCGLTSLGNKAQEDKNN
jgi:hypothetical protein